MGGQATDVLDLLSLLRGALNPLTEEAWTLVDQIDCELGRDADASKREQQLAKHLKGQMSELFARGGKDALLTPIWLTISVLEVSVEARTARKEAQEPGETRRP